MAKIRKLKLSWQASESEMVVGYKIYWSKDAQLSYNSKCIDVGKVSEIVLPDGISFIDGPIMFGVTALDKDGNESHMATLPVPYHLRIPEPPAGLSILNTEEFKVLGSKTATKPKMEIDGNEDTIADAIESHDKKETPRMKYYYDVGYREGHS